MSNSQFQQAIKTREFFKEYADPHFSIKPNIIKLSQENTFEHNMKVCEVCVHLLKLGIPFYTEVRLRCGLRPDIIVPTHVKQIIEILHTETEEKFIELKKSKLPEELKEEVILIKTNKPFRYEDLF